MAESEVKEGAEGEERGGGREGRGQAGRAVQAVPGVQVLSRAKEETRRTDEGGGESCILVREAPRPALGLGVSAAPRRWRTACAGWSRGRLAVARGDASTSGCRLWQVGHAVGAVNEKGQCGERGNQLSSP